MRRVDNDFFDVVKVLDLLTHLEGEIDEGLALILRAVFLRVRIENRDARVAGFRKRHLIRALRAVEHVGDNAVLAFVDRGGALLAAHGAVDRFNRKFAGVRRGVRFPTGNFALARLARRERHVNGLLNRLINRRRIQAEQGADAGRLRGGKMRDVVFLVLVQADALDEIDLNLIPDEDAAYKIRPAQPIRMTALLGDRQNRRDVVPGM